MFYHFLYPLRDYFSGFNIFKYITIRAALAAITSLLICFIVGPYIIKLLKKHQIGEIIRKNGPKTHLNKEGTPTMGGIIILLSVLISSFLWADITNPYIVIMLISTLWMGAIGFLDDYLKVVRHYKKGLVAKYKLIGQITLGLFVGLFLYFSPHFADTNSLLSIPYFKNLEVDIGWLYIPFIILVITGTSNAVNLTDGLDGLSAGLMGIIALSLAIISYITGRVDFSDYLNTIYLPGSGELAIYSLAFAGSMFGFLWFNSYPASIFMGDIGAIGMGGALGVLSVLIKKEILLFFIGGVFVVETLSVAIQVYYFKWTKWRTGEGKRVFLMAPLHHHFELKGWAEPKVVVRFWILGILLALIGLSSFKIL